MYDPQVDVDEGIRATVVQILLAWGVSRKNDGPLADCLGWWNICSGVGFGQPLKEVRQNFSVRAPGTCASVAIIVDNVVGDGSVPR